GKGAPTKAGSHEVHGAPLGDAELRAMKEALGFPPGEAFHIPGEVAALFAARTKKLTARQARWNRAFKKWRRADHTLAHQWDIAHEPKSKLPDDFSALVPKFEKPIATRSASGVVLNAVARALPSLIGGSADLAPSTMTWLDGFDAVTRENFAGRNLHFGIREFGMAAVMNGIARHGGFRVFGATFFVFSDYARPAVRLAALMGLPVVYVFTHDSFYVGEDGPTHQPVEHLAALRAIPGLTVLRPADATETVEAWRVALENKSGPTVLCLSRQNITPLDREQLPPARLLEKGAYTLWQAKPATTPDAILIATGSEVELALAAARQSPANLRVVSMPSWELFEQQPQAYRDAVLPPACERRLAIEAGSSFGWHRYASDFLTLDTFGASAPFKDLCQRFGFTTQNLLARIQALLDGQTVKFAGELQAK
ncbi:MAG: transketolase, partial [Kiritimatiellaeota bacterium]|nr:transketolase [Kiritimatiellota bacterium]